MSLGTGNEPSKAVGQYHSLKGSAVEAIGHMVGSETWVQSGKREHEAGEAEYEVGRAKGYAEGVANQVTGKVTSVTGTLTGDEERRKKGELQQNKGETLAALNKP